MKELIDRIYEVISLDQLFEYDLGVATLLRRQDYHDVSWEQSEKIALRILLKIEDSIYRFNPDDVNGNVEKPLILCGQILWNCAQRTYSISSEALERETEESAIYLALKAITCFIYCANLSNAYAVADTVSEWITPDYSKYNYFIEVIKDLYNFVGIEFIDQNDNNLVGLLEFFRNLININYDDALTRIENDFPSLSSELPFAESSISIDSIVYSFETALEWLAKHLTVHAVDGYLGTLSNYSTYREALKNYGPHFIFPSQRNALRKLQNISKTTNVMITYPTSTGKTFLGEILALEALLRNDSGLSVYLVPLRALVSQQKLDVEFKNRLDRARINFVSAMGGYLDEIRSVNPLERTFMIATPEAFDYLWRTQPIIRQILKAVVIDEFQIIEQGGRGVGLECMCANFLDLQRDGRLDRLVLLSAVVDQTDKVQEWLNIPDDAVLRTDWSATQKRVTIQKSDNTAKFYAQPTNGYEDLVSELSSRYSSGQRSVVSRKNKRNYTKALARIHQAIVSMAMGKQKQFGGCVLILCGSRLASREVCQKLSQAQQMQPINENELAGTIKSSYIRLSDLINAKYPYLATLKTSISRRICYHSAELPDEIRQIVEDLIRQDFFEFVCSTTTLAEGVNLPFRTVIMERWHRTSDISYDALIVRNIAGRAGRAGHYVEGDTIFSDNIFSSQLIDADSILNDLFLKKSVALESVLEDFKIDHMTSSGKVDVDSFSNAYMAAESISSLSRLQSFLLSYIDTHNSIEDASTFINRLLISVENPKLSEQIRVLLNDTIDYQTELKTDRLITRNSPVRLTNTGKLASKTGLSLNSINTILASLRELQPADPPRKNNSIAKFDLSWDEWLAAIFESKIRHVDELEVDWLKTSTRRTTPINRQNINLLIWAWFSGWSYPSILWLIKYRNKSENWIWPLINSEKSSKIEDELLALQQFCESWFSYSWNWIFSGIQFLAEGEDRFNSYLFSPDQDKLQTLKRAIHWGVDNELACNILEHRRDENTFPGSREHAQILSKLVRNSNPDAKVIADMLIVLEDESILEDLDSIVLDGNGASLSILNELMRSRVINWINEIMEN